jgi:hypothetical protein
MMLEISKYYTTIITLKVNIFFRLVREPVCKKEKPDHVIRLDGGDPLAPPAWPFSASWREGNYSLV